MKGEKSQSGKTKYCIVFWKKHYIWYKCCQIKVFVKMVNEDEKEEENDLKYDMEIEKLNFFWATFKKQ